MKYTVENYSVVDNNDPENLDLTLYVVTDGINEKGSIITEEAIENADIITTVTADKRYQTILTEDMIKKDVFINALGGDCPGKTELSTELVKKSKVVVEFLEQSKIEGEIQHLGDEYTCPELHEVVNGKVDLNVQKDGTIIFDSVGFALQDYSVLRLTYELAKEHGIGQEMNLIPDMKDVKDLYSLLK